MRHGIIIKETINPDGNSLSNHELYVLNTLYQILLFYRPDTQFFRLKVKTETTIDIILVSVT